MATLFQGEGPVNQAPSSIVLSPGLLTHCTDSSEMQEVRPWR